MQSNVITVQPTAEPITLTEAKAHLNVSSSNDDTLITSLIVSARMSAEAYQWRQLMTATRRQTLDCFSSDSESIILPFPTLQSVTTVSYTDSDGATQTWDSSNYTVDIDSLPGRLYPIYNGSYPTTRDVRKAVQITYICGYASASDVPQGTKQAMLLITGDLYTHRESFVVGTIVSKFPNAVESLLNQNAVRY